MKHGLANLDEPRPDGRRTGLRAACNVLSTHLGIPKVERWAGRSYGRTCYREPGKASASTMP